jgi:fructose-bisphosphate aldolase, class I
MTGTLRRLARFFHPVSGRMLLAPMDQGIYEGMMPGIGEIPALLHLLRGLPVQGVILNKGMARAYLTEIPLETQLVVQLSAGTKHCIPPYARGVVSSANEAHRMGADAVAMQVNIGNDLEDRMLADFGMVCDDAHGLGLPVFALIHPKGGHIVNELDPTLIAHCIRLAAELGADVAGVPFSSDPVSFTAAVAASPIPVLVTGGPKQPDFESLLTMIGKALECGAAGSCVGRNFFTRPEPEVALTRIIELVHGKEAEPE